MDWEDLKVFLAIANGRGLKKAALKLGLHHTTCARRLTNLEADLGTTLFDRLPSGYALTEAGNKLLRSSALIQDEINGIELDLMGKDIRLEGPIKLSMPNGFATHLLIPSVLEFMKQFPLVHVQINMTYAFSDLDKREADIAIRHVDEPPMSLAGKKVGRLFRSAYASKTYLQNHDPVSNPQDCHWLGWGDASGHLSWAQKKKFPVIPVRGDIYSDVLQMSAAQAHMGITSLPCFLGDSASDLERIPTAEAEFTDTLWVLAHRNMISNARVQALMNHLVVTFAALKPKLEGRL